MIRLNALLHRQVIDVPIPVPDLTAAVHNSRFLHEITIRGTRVYAIVNAATREAAAREKLIGGRIHCVLQHVDKRGKNLYQLVRGTDDFTLRLTREGLTKAMWMRLRSVIRLPSCLLDLVQRFLFVAGAYTLDTRDFSGPPLQLQQLPASNNFDILPDGSQRTRRALWDRTYQEGTDLSTYFAVATTVLYLCADDTDQNTILFYRWGHLHGKGFGSNKKTKPAFEERRSSCAERITTAYCNTSTRRVEIHVP